MAEENIFEGKEQIQNQPNKQVDSVENELNKEELIPARAEQKSQDKIKEAGKQIASKASSIQEKEKVMSHVKEVAQIDRAEDQIKKLTEIATQDNPKVALRVAKKLNSNYVLDEIHDRLIDEDALRKVLIEKGFIEKAS